MSKPNATRARSGPQAPVSVREAKKQANRQAFIDAGKRVFTEMGLGAATVRDIVRESGLAQGSFYNYFDTKEAVFEVIVAEVCAAVRSMLRAKREAVRPDEDPRGLVSAGYRLLIELTALDPATAALIRRNQDAFREEFYQGPARSAIVGDLVEDLEARKASGVLLPHDSAELAETMIALGVDLIVLALHSREAALRRAAFLEDMFSRAFLPRELLEKPPASGG